MIRPIWISIAVLVIAVWVLAAHTVGETIGQSNSTVIGFAVAILVGLGAYHLAAVQIPAPLAGRLAIWLVGGGVVLLLAGLGLQLYLSSLSSEHARRAADVVEQAARNGQRVPDVNIRSTTPASVGAIGYACVLAGIGAMVCGVRVGMSSMLPAVPASPADTGQ